jgi:hypothetical protein
VVPDLAVAPALVATAGRGKHRTDRSVGLPQGVPVTKPEQESAGDYGYDLAHEQTGRPPARVDHPDHQHGRAGSPGGKGDRQEDFGYDEAHDF